MIREYVKAAVLAAFADHGLDQPKTAFARIIRAVGDRLSVQKKDASDNIDDANPIEVWPGVPGVTSDPTEGEDVVLVFVGKDQTPIVMGRASKQAPGSVPVEVRHDASSTIRFVSRTESVAGKVLVGNTTHALARADDVQALLTALKGAATSMNGSVVPEVVAVGGILQAALNSLSITPTAKLEAE